MKENFYWIIIGLLAASCVIWDNAHCQGVFEKDKTQQNDTAAFIQDDTFEPSLVHYFLNRDMAIDSAFFLKKDSLLAIKNADSLAVKTDSLEQTKIDSSQAALSTKEETTPKIQTTFNYQPKNEPKINNDFQPYKKQDKDTIIFYLLLFVAALFAFAKHYFATYVKVVFKSFGNLNLANQFFEEYDFKNSLGGILLTFNSLVIFTIFGYCMVNYGQQLQGVNNQMLLVALFLGITLYMGIRYLMLHFSAIILPVQETIRFYMFNIRIINIVMSICLIPCLMLLAFTYQPIIDIAFYTTLILIGILLIYRYYRGFIIGKKIIRFHKFHFFIYLCTLEIAPLLIAYKLVSQLLI